MQNCLLESLLEKTIEKCQCIPNFASWFHIIDLIEQPLLGDCRGKNLKCSNELQKQFGDPNMNLTHARDINGISKKCLQSCELLTLESSISSRPVGNSPDLWQIARKLIMLCKKPKLFDKRYKMNCNEVNRILEDQTLNTEAGSVYHNTGIFRYLVM